MANIAGYVTQIEKTKRGEDVRDAIINSLASMDEEGTNAQSLNGHAASEFILKDEYYSSLFFDQIPVKNSKKAVTSHGLYGVFSQINIVLDNINGEEIQEYDNSTPIESLTINGPGHEIVYDQPGQDTMQLTVDILPTNATNKRIRWTASNEHAIVNQKGLVRGVSYGTVTITAHARDKSNRKDNYIINVVNKGYIYSITITTDKGNSPTIYYNSEGARAIVYSLSREFYGGRIVTENMPEYAPVTWHSSDRNILDIDENGYITAKEVTESTTVTIYCIVNDSKAKKSNELTITVEPPQELEPDPEVTPVVEPIEGD